MRVGERLARRAVPLAPICCPLQVHGQQLRVAPLELRTEEIAEQMVVAIPLAVIVERDDEGIGTREVLKRSSRVVYAEHCIAQGRRHVIEDRRPEQETLEMVRLAVQHLFHEVVGDLLLIAGQTGSPHGGIVTAAQRQRGQRNRGGPALRPLAQGPGRRLRELQSCARGNITGLHRVQGEERGPDLDQIPTCAEPAERHPRIAARDQHQLTAGSNLVDEKRENRAALLSRYDIHIVQHQNERIALAEVRREERKDDLIDPGHPS